MPGCVKVLILSEDGKETLFFLPAQVDYINKVDYVIKLGELDFLIGPIYVIVPCVAGCFPRLCLYCMLTKCCY